MGQSVLRRRRKPLQRPVFCSHGRDSLDDYLRKGVGLIFPNWKEEDGASVPGAATPTNSETSAIALGRVVFSL